MQLTRQFSKREKFLFVVLAILLIGCAYYYLVQEPVHEAITTADSQIAAYQNEAAILRAKKAHMDSMQAELDELIASDSLVEVPAYDNLPQVITFINAVTSGVKSYELSFVGVVEDEVIARRGAQVSFVAPSYEDACRIIGQLQDCDFCCRVSNVAFAPASSWKTIRDGEVSVSANITFFETVD